MKIGLIFIGLVLGMSPTSAYSTEKSQATVDLYYVNDDSFAGNGTFISTEILVTAASIMDDLESGGVRLKNGSESIEVFSHNGLLLFDPRNSASLSHNVALVRFPPIQDRSVAPIFMGDINTLKNQPELKIIFHEKDSFAIKTLKAFLIENFEEKTSEWIYSSQNSDFLNFQGILGAGLYLRKGKKEELLGFYNQIDTSSSDSMAAEKIQFFSLLGSKAGSELILGTLKKHPEYFKRPISKSAQNTEQTLETEATKVPESIQQVAPNARPKIKSGIECSVTLHTKVTQLNKDNFSFWVEHKNHSTHYHFATRHSLERKAEFRVKMGAACQICQKLIFDFKQTKMKEVGLEDDCFVICIDYSAGKTDTDLEEFIVKDIPPCQNAISGDPDP